MMSDTDTPPLTATYLGIGDDSQLSRSPRFAGQSSVGGFSSSTDSRARGDPISNLDGDDLDQGYSGVMRGAVMLPVFEITEERRDPGQTVSEDVTSSTGISDEHWRPKFLDEILVLGDFRGARDTCPSGSLLVIERHIDI
jgi:hypothetical protein